MGGGGLEGEMRGSQNSLTVLFFKDSRKSAYLQLVDKLSARLQIRRINQFPLLAPTFFKQSDHTNKKNQNKNQARRTISLQVQTKKHLQIRIILQSLNSAKHFKYLRLFAFGNLKV